MATRTSYMVAGMDELPVDDVVISAEPYDPVQPQIVTETVALSAGGYGGVLKVEVGVPS
jgi:hypothetical protein